MIGQGAQRFVLPYQPEKGYPAFAQLIIEMEDLASLKVYMSELEKQLNQRFPQAQYRFKNMENGPSPAAKIEARFYGDDPEVLRALGAQAEAIFHAEPSMDGVRHDWRNQVPLIRPQLQNDIEYYQDVLSGKIKTTFILGQKVSATENLPIQLVLLVQNTINDLRKELANLS